MKLTYAILRKQRTLNLRYIVRTLLMKLAPGIQNVYQRDSCNLVLIGLSLERFYDLARF